MILQASRDGRYVAAEVILVLTGLLFCPSSARAQSLSWNALGPAGSYVRVVAIDFQNPQTVYAGLVEDVDHPLFGVYKSLDGGNTWNAVNNGLPVNCGVFALTFDPTNSSTLYVGLNNDYSYAGGGIYKSTDGGNTWTLLPAPANWGYMSLAVSPVNPSVVYAGTYNWGLLISNDGGMTWSQANGVAIYESVNAIAIDPQNPNNVYAGSTNGLFVSIDAGNTWNMATNGLPDGADFGAIAINPVTSTVLAGLNAINGADGGGMFMSSDVGNTWLPVGNGVAAGYEIHTIAIDPITPTNVYTGTFGAYAFISTDGGYTFSDFSAGLGDVYVHSIAINPQTTTIVYAGTCNTGVYILTPTSSDDSGDSATVPAGRASSPDRRKRFLP
jgi:photosystem II stability/assembly factor-like uncharacterized protein